jgi:hypothetical protein
VASDLVVAAFAGPTLLRVIARDVVFSIMWPLRGTLQAGKKYKHD